MFLLHFLFYNTFYNTFFILQFYDLWILWLIFSKWQVLYKIFNVLKYIVQCGLLKAEIGTILKLYFFSIVNIIFINYIKINIKILIG